jgi:hypothetical protein
MRKQTGQDRCPVRRTIGFSHKADERLKQFTTQYAIGKFDFVSLLLENTPLDAPHVKAFIEKFKQQLDATNQADLDLARKLRTIPPEKLRAALQSVGVALDDPVRDQRG